MSNQFRVVQVGCGSMGNGWVENALKTPDVSMVGLVDINPSAAKAMAEKHQLPETVCYSSLKEALASTDANIVFDVTIPSAHEAVVTEALAAGRDVLGEKPMSDSLASAQRMVDAARKAKRTYAIMQNYRYNPEIRSYKQIITDGQIGPVDEVHAEMFLGAHFGGFRDQMDYPLILDMSIHTFDAARFLSGADPVSVYCHSFNPQRSWYRGDASAVAVFEFTGGLVFSFRGSWCAEGLQTPFASYWRIIGQKGTAKWDGENQPLAKHVKPDGKHGFFSELQEIPAPVVEMPVKGHGALMADFFTALKQGTQPETSCQDNIKSLAMVFAAVESAKTGKKVPVKW